MTGKIEAIFVAESKRSKVNSVNSAQLEAGRGIIGDRYHILSNEHVKANVNVLQNHITFVEKENLDAFLCDHKSQFRSSLYVSSGKSVSMSFRNAS